jgi:hypothetical protein
MVSVQSFIRAEVSCGAFPAPSGAEAYSEYAIASAKNLIPEMENAASDIGLPTGVSHDNHN